MIGRALEAASSSVGRSRARSMSPLIVNVPSLVLNADVRELDVRSVEDHLPLNRLHRHAPLSRHARIRPRCSMANGPLALRRARTRGRSGCGARESRRRAGSRDRGNPDCARLSPRTSMRRAGAFGSRRPRPGGRFELPLASRVIVTLPRSTATSSKRSLPRYAAQGSLTRHHSRVKNGLSRWPTAASRTLVSVTRRSTRL